VQINPLEVSEENLYNLCLTKDLKYLQIGRVNSKTVEMIKLSDIKRISINDEPV